MKLTIAVTTAALMAGCVHDRAYHLTADTAVTTPSGATFVAPKGWWLTNGRQRILLEDPDRLVRATLVETDELDGTKAIAAAWKRFAPGLALVLREEPERPPPEHGWDAVTKAEYEMSSSGGRAASAIARRYGQHQYVVLINGDGAAVDRRAAELYTALGTLKPTGMREESWRGRAPRPVDVRALDDFIADALARLAVPGAAVAVIENGQVAYERAFGVRALGHPEPVTPSTLFMIGSITKSITTLMQAALVDAGEFGWDTPVTTLLPGFAVGDPELTKKLVLWQMSCMCSGMPAEDLPGLFEFGDVTPEQRMASMKTMKPTAKLGEAFQYASLMVAAGGFAAAHAHAPERSLGDAYDATMRQVIFEPIGMHSTTLDFAAVERAEHALPHALGIDGDVRSIPLSYEHDILPFRPAGGVWTSLRDFERWVMTELADGVSPDGRRVVSAANLRERRRLRVRAGDSGGYGLGLGIGSYRDLPRIAHEGGSLGFGSTMFMLPESGVAVLILTNVRNGGSQEELPFNAAVLRKALELIFDGRPFAAPSLNYFVELHRRAAHTGAAHVERNPDPAWLASLAGHYSNDSLGGVEVSGSVFDVGEWRSAFGRRRESDGTFKLILLDPPFAGGEITVGGTREAPTLIAEDGQLRYIFQRRGAPSSGNRR